MNKIVISLFILFFLLGSSAWPKQKQQDSTQKPLTADEIVAKLKLQLGLNDQQVDEVKSIVQNYLDQQKALLREERKQLSKVLSGQQLFTWDFLQKEPTLDKKKHQSLF